MSVQPFASRFSVYRNGAQGPYAQNTVHNIEWNAEIFDGLSEMAVIAPYRLIPKRAGYYLLNAGVHWSLAVNEWSRIFIMLNGATILVDTWSLEGQAATNHAKVVTIVHLTPNDFIEVRTLFDLVGVTFNKFISGTREWTYFNGHRLS